MKKSVIFLGILLAFFGVLGGGMLSKTIPELEQEENLELAIYVDDERQSTIPQKENADNYVFDKATCFVNGKEDASVTISWDSEAWAPIVKGLTTYKTRCDLYFKKMSFNEAILACNQNKNAAECFLENASLNSTELAYDETADNNLRYFGANPNNYVSFNNELWRIIGVMNNIDNGTGKKESRIKIIRDEPIGNYSWDNKAEGVGSSISFDGSNDWSDSALQIVLNSGAYYNRTIGECPSGSMGETTSCDFTNTGLTEKAKNMIGDAVWNLGGSSTYNDVTASMFYERERGTDVYNGRPTEWIGKIGLIYPSDFGYATGGESAEERTLCLSTALVNWTSSNYKYCKNYDWLYDSSNSQWALTPISNESSRVFLAPSSSLINNPVYNNSFSVSPALYLSSNVKISGGDGSSSNPYQIA